MIDTATESALSAMSTRTPLVRPLVLLLRRVKMSAREVVEPPYMLLTPSTSVVARPTMVAMTSVAKDTVPLLFVSSCTFAG